MKTPEEMAREYADDWHKDCDYPEPLLSTARKATKTIFLAGYEAAKDQLADADKVITYDYVETASKHAEELIGEFELSGNKDMLVKALVAAYCSGIDAVDGHLRNSLSAYRTSVRRQQWISVKERLPRPGQEVLIVDDQIMRVQAVSSYGEWHPYVNGSSCKPTHWMPLPEPPKDAKE